MGVRFLRNGKSEESNNLNDLNNTHNLNLNQLINKVDLYNNFSFLELDNSITNLNELYYNNSSIHSIPSIAANNVTEAYRMCESCDNLSDAGEISLPNCNNYRAMFSGCLNLKSFPLKPSNFTNDSTYRYTYNGCSNITEPLHDINITNCELNNAFANAGNNVIYNINITNCELTNAFANAGSNAIYNMNIDNSIINRAFYGMKNIEYIENFTLTNCDYTAELFYNCQNLVNITNFSIDGSGLIPHSLNLTNAFYNCNNLSNIAYASIANGLPNTHDVKTLFLSNMYLDINNFDNEQIQILANKGYSDAQIRCINASNISNYWNIYNGTSWTNIEKGDLYDYDGTNLKSNIPNTASVTNITIIDDGIEGTLYTGMELFRAKSYLKDIDISNINTHKICSTENMFRSCSNLTTVSNFDTSNVYAMTYMFGFCYNLTTVPNFDTSNVVHTGTMFSNCYNLISVPNFDLSNVAYMANMFKACYNLTTVPEFDTREVNNFTQTFQKCNSLSNASIQNIINMCLNSNVTNSKRKNLNTFNQQGPLYQTKFGSTYYQNRLAELDAAGWTY